jgi:BirA family transcriptional regulator, biotin operon repressor / biotin---[acetyl-CoA-carboxylase] ligase
MGYNLVSMPECHSTNDVLQQLIEEKGLTEGMVVITEYQTAGRGQRGNTWKVEAGKNLTLSVALKPVFLMAREHFILTMLASLAVCDCIRELIPGADVKIKWPNDIMLDGKKVCGILIENQVVGQQIGTSIAGIGLNVNQLNFSVAIATSLALASGVQFDLQNVFDLLLQKLEARYLQTRSGDFHVLKENYEANLFRREVVHDFIVDGQTIQGTILGAQLDGLLLVHVSGVLRKFAFKEITYVLP